MQAADIILGLISCILTIMVLSYLVGDNPLFRVAVFIFVGVSAGYVGAVALYQVILPKVIMPLVNDPRANLALLMPILLSLLLLAKIFPRISWLGSASMAFMVGVSAAVAIAGALIGTIVPQFIAAIAPFGLEDNTGVGSILENLAEGAIMLLGTVTTLAYFHFGVKTSASGTGSTNPVMRVLGLIGQFFIAVTFGVLFTGAYAAAVSALIARMYFIWTYILSFF
ncbi:MAG: putative rane protein [Proteobacteria bacterium]|nr:putative rane protein [Pseudomonadota bacterium]